MNSETPSQPSLRLGAAEKIYLPRLASALGPTRDSPQVVRALLTLAQQDGADAELIYSLASQMRARYGPYPWDQVKPESQGLPPTGEQPLLESQVGDYQENQSLPPEMPSSVPSGE